MSDERFSYIHLRPEIDLWSYVDDHVDWCLGSLDDRLDQSIWDLIPPYQNEDDEGLLPSHAHPSYPFGNPYDSTCPAPHETSIFLERSHKPLAMGSSLLIPNQPIDPIQADWTELATDRLLGGGFLQNGLTNNSHQLDHHDLAPTDHPPTQQAHQPSAPASAHHASVQTGPVEEASRVGSQGSMNDQAEGASEWDGDQD